MSTTLTSKGQVTVPKKIRDYLGLRPGSAVRFSMGTNGEVIILPEADGPPRRGRSRLGHLRGTLKTGQSTDDLMCLLRDYDSDARDPGFK